MRLFATEREAQEWVREQQEIYGPRFNYFVGFRNADPNLSYGISAGVAAWVPPGRTYISDIFPHIIH